MSYGASATTLPYLISSVVNMTTLRPALPSPFVAGLRFIPIPLLIAVMLVAPAFADAERAFRIQFKAVSEFETANAQRTRLISSEAFEADERLFQEDAGGTVRICRVVRSTETQLSLRSRCNSMRGQTDQPRLSEFKKPIVRTRLPAGGDTKQRRISVAIVGRRRFEEIPILESKPDAAVNRPTRNSDDTRRR